MIRHSESKSKCKSQPHLHLHTFVRVGKNTHPAAGLQGHGGTDREVARGCVRVFAGHGRIATRGCCRRLGGGRLGGWRPKGWGRNGGRVGFRSGPGVSPYGGQQWVRQLWKAAVWCQARRGAAAAATKRQPNAGEWYVQQRRVEGTEFL